MCAAKGIVVGLLRHDKALADIMIVATARAERLGASNTRSIAAHESLMDIAIAALAIRSDTIELTLEHVVHSEPTIDHAHMPRGAERVW